MKKNILNLSFYLVLTVLSIAGGLFFTNSQNIAQARVSDWNPGRIIDDGIFTNKDSMSVSQIQSFLNSKVPTCDTAGAQRSEMNNNGIPDYNGNGSIQRWEWGKAKYGQETFPCLRDYNENGKSSAQIIYEASQEFNINPQVLIVLLQKEQSLVTDTWPLNIQYRSATGYGCPDTAPCDSQYYGLTNQLRWASRMFRSIMNASPGWYTPYILGSNYIQYNPTASCGGSTVYIENRATQALYNYTPYQPNEGALNADWGSASCGAYGNRNFYLYFRDWFGSTRSGEYISPLYRSSTSGQIYALVEDRKFYIPSYDIMVAYGFHKLTITNVSDSYLATYTDAGALTNIGRKQYDPSGAIYLFDDGKHYHIQSPEQCADWGIDCFNGNVSKVLPNALVDRYITSGGALPSAVYNNNILYVLEGGKKRPVLGDYKTRQYSPGQPIYFKDYSVARPVGKAIIDDRYIVKFGDNPTLYLHDRGMLYSIDDIRYMTDWGLNSLNGSHAPALYDTDPLPRVAALQPVAQNVSGELYIVADGYKYPLGNRSVDFSNQAKTVFTYPDAQLDRLPSKTLSDVIRARDSGEIFTVSNNKKRVFASIDDIKNLGFNLNSNSNLPQSIANQLGYDGLNIATGRLYKVRGSNELRLRSGDGYLYVGSMSYPTLNYSTAINVDAETGILYRYLGDYGP